MNYSFCYAEDNVLKNFSNPAYLLPLVGNSCLRILRDSRYVDIYNFKPTSPETTFRLAGMCRCVGVGINSQRVDSPRPNYLYTGHHIIALPGCCFTPSLLFSVLGKIDTLRKSVSDDRVKFTETIGARNQRDSTVVRMGAVKMFVVNIYADNNTRGIGCGYNF